MKIRDCQELGGKRWSDSKGEEYEEFAWVMELLPLLIVVVDTWNLHDLQSTELYTKKGPMQFYCNFISKC